MEKISGILPASARITSVDLKNSGVARSGSPSFGRPQGSSSVVRKQQDVFQSAAERHSEAMSLRHPSQMAAKDPQVAIVEKISSDFFMKPVVSGPEVLAAEMPVDYGPSADLDPQTNTREDLDLPEVGGYLDVTV